MMCSGLLFTALSAALLLSAAQAQSGATTVTTVSEAAALPAPEAQLEVQLPFQLSESQLQRGAGRQLVVAQPLPSGARLVAGSTALDGQPAAAPKVGRSGTLYWTVPAAASGTLTFSVTGVADTATLPAASLAWADQAGSLSPVAPQSAAGLSAADYLTARPALPAQRTGVIVSPAPGSEYRTTDQTTVVLEGPLDQPLTLQVNGQAVPESRLGKQVKDPGHNLLRLEYFGVQLQPGRNVIQAGQDQIEVWVASSVQQVTAEGVQLVADGSTPLRVRVRALDANGIGSAASFVTVNSNLEPLRPDAQPGVSGYQLALNDGEGILELKPQATPQTLRLELLSGDRVWTQNLDIVPDQREVGVGMLSATVGLNGEPLNGAVWQGRASYEGPVGEGKLYVSADKDGLPQTPGVRENNERFTNYGDKSTETVPLRSTGPVAALYEHPSFRASYRYDALPSDVLPLGQQMTHLAAETKGDVRVGAFVAPVSGTAVTDDLLTPDGTRLLRLGQTDIVPGSLGLVLVTSDPLTGAEISRRTLQEGREWVADPVSGVITLTRALAPTDEALNRQAVLASYRLGEAGADLSLAYGAQVTAQGTADVLGRAGSYTVGAAAASVDGKATFGVRGVYRDLGLNADGRVLVSGGVLAEAKVSGQATSAALTAASPLRGTNTLSVRYQSEGYSGLGAGAPGLRASGTYYQPVSERFGASLSAQYDSAQPQNYAEVLGLYTSAPWTLGGGARYTFGERSGLGATGAVGYRDRRLSAELKHSQPVSGDAHPETEFGTSYRVAENVTLTAKDRYVWGEGHLASVGLVNRIGNTSYEIGYETGADGGQTSRARLGAGTTWALDERTSVGLRGNYVRTLETAENLFSVSSDVRYRGDGYQASAGADVKYSDQSGLSSVVRGAVTGELTPRLSLSADGTAEFGSRQGLKFGAGYAYRAEALNSLGYLRYASGSLAGRTPEMTAGAAAEYVADPLRVRGGIDMRVLLEQPDSLTYQPYIGAQYRAADRLMLGAWGRALVQPASRTSLYGYGLEGGYRVLDNTWLTVGYNPRGFEGLSAAGLYTKQGAYLRLDLTLDERTRH